MTVAEPFVLSRSIAWPHFGHNLAAVTVNSGHSNRMGHTVSQSDPGGQTATDTPDSSSVEHETHCVTTKLWTSPKFRFLRREIEHPISDVVSSADVADGTIAGGGQRDACDALLKSEQRSPIMTAGAWVLPRTMVGMMPVVPHVEATWFPV
jgi:hypothetical protein